MARLLYQGHGSYRIVSDGGTVVYVDPFAGEGYDLPADLVLVSHEHRDHNRVGLVALKDGGRIWRSADLLQGGVYGSFTYGDFAVQATPAYNGHHDRDKCVGFLIAVDGLKIYAAGDTSKTDYMADTLAKESLDYAILPADGIFNMGVKEASACAALIGARHTIPVHMKPGGLFSRRKADAFQAPAKLVLEPGEEIRL